MSETIKSKEEELTPEPTKWDNLGESTELLRSKLVDMQKCSDGELARDFPNGVFLFHGARVEQIEKIFEHGAIVNAGSLGKSSNSGLEGISWSANGIDALPGTRGHIAGFVAAPEEILGENKLVVPSRPAPYELLQVSGGINTEEFYRIKKQHEVWGYKDISLYEKASVDSGLYFFVASNISNNNGVKFNSQLKDFVERGGLPADELRKHYMIAQDGRIIINEDLHQQKFDEHYLPPAAVWIQVMIDQGMFKNTSADRVEDVNEIVKIASEDKDLTYQIFGQAREQGKRYDDDYERELVSASGIAAPIEKMFFVTSRKDLDGWIALAQKTGHYPKGYLLYDEDKVKREHFAQSEEGDNEELSKEIARTVGANEEFWFKKMGMDVPNIPRAGTRGQVLRDSSIDHKKEIKIEEGNLIIKD